MIKKAINRIEFGDFQTPDPLAEEICILLRGMGVVPKTIVEPTCGQGSFLRACLNVFPECSRLLGFDVNSDYVQQAQALPRVEVQLENFFYKDWHGTLDTLDDEILVIGNPPWVTNSTVGSINGENLPTKSNFQRLRGFDAVTGKSNFDISEWMLLQLIEALSGKQAVIAMLCKTVVARKVLSHIWKHSLQVTKSAIYSIDADKHFGAAVSACLLVCYLRPGSESTECDIHQHLGLESACSRIGLRDDRLVSDLGAFRNYAHLAGKCPLKWRSGVKHDCARVVELRPKSNNEFENKLGETVRLESSYLFPMLKSSELARPDSTPSRLMLVTQRSVGEDTSRIQHVAPMTWAYLLSHEHLFNRRSSSIYKNRPRFSIFGIGPYSFAPWKVAISGFYKRFDFRCIGPFDDRPVVVDDTCYFLPCRTEGDAALLTALLNSESAKGLLRSLAFWDAKRPITAQLLGNLDLSKLADEAGVSLPSWVDTPRRRGEHTDSSLFSGFEPDYVAPQTDNGGQARP